MKATRKILPTRAPFDLKVEASGSLDLSAHESSVNFANYSKLVNVVKDGSRLVPRVGASSWTAVNTFSGKSGATTEWMYRKDISVGIYVNQRTLETEVLFGNVVLSGQKAFLLGTTNQVRQRSYSSVNGSGSSATRKMGISAPKATSKTVLANTGMESGYYVWGFEFVQYDTGVVIRRSGARRVLRGDIGLTDRPTDVLKLYSQGEVDWVLLATHADGTAIATDTSWTHIRMYRSKMITTSEDVDTGIGSASELYLVYERTRAAWIADSYKMNDAVADVDIDDSTVVLIDGIDLVPLPAAEYGCYSNGRIVLGGDLIRAYDVSPTRLIFSNPVGSAYDEVYAPLTNYLDCATDGTPIQAVFNIGDDLIVIKRNETGIVRGGKRENGYQVIDANIGVNRFLGSSSVVVFAKYIEGLGIFAINSDGVLRLFDSSLQWTKFIGSFDFSSPMEEIFTGIYNSAFSGKWFDVKYHNGMVVFNIYAATNQIGALADVYATTDLPVPNPAQLNGSTGIILVLDIRNSPYWTSFSFPSTEEYDIMYKDHDDKLYLANELGILNISQNASTVNDAIIPSEEYAATSFPVITIVKSGIVSSNEGLYEFRGMNLRASTNLNGFLYFNYDGLSPNDPDSEGNYRPDKKLKLVSYDNETANSEDLKNISTEIVGAGRFFQYLIHSNSNLQLETISFDGIQQSKVISSFDPFNKNQDEIDSLTMQDQIFWMARPNPLKSNSHRAKLIVEVPSV